MELKQLINYKKTQFRNEIRNSSIQAILQKNRISNWNPDQNDNYQELFECSKHLKNKINEFFQRGIEPNIKQELSLMVSQIQRVDCDDYLVFQQLNLFEDLIYFSQKYDQQDSIMNLQINKILFFHTQIQDLDKSLLVLKNQQINYLNLMVQNLKSPKSHVNSIFYIASGIKNIILEDLTYLQYLQDLQIYNILLNTFNQQIFDKDTIDSKIYLLNILFKGPPAPKLSQVKQFLPIFALFINPLIESKSVILDGILSIIKIGIDQDLEQQIIDFFLEQNVIYIFIGIGVNNVIKRLLTIQRKEDFSFILFQLFNANNRINEHYSKIQQQFLFNFFNFIQDLQIYQILRFQIIQMTIRKHKWLQSYFSSIQVQNIDIIIIFLYYIIKTNKHNDFIMDNIIMISIDNIEPDNTLALNILCNLCVGNSKTIKILMQSKILNVLRNGLDSSNKQNRMISAWAFSNICACEDQEIIEIILQDQIFLRCLFLLQNDIISIRQELMHAIGNLIRKSDLNQIQNLFIVFQMDRILVDNLANFESLDNGLFILELIEYILKRGNDYYQKLIIKKGFYGEYSNMPKNVVKEILEQQNLSNILEVLLTQNTNSQINFRIIKILDNFYN